MWIWTPFFSWIFTWVDVFLVVCVGSHLFQSILMCLPLSCLIFSLTLFIPSLRVFTLSIDNPSTTKWGMVFWMQGNWQVWNLQVKFRTTQRTFLAVGSIVLLTVVICFEILDIILVYRVKILHVFWLVWAFGTIAKILGGRNTSMSASILGYCEHCTT